jgi:hypothetical protein
LPYLSSRLGIAQSQLPQFQLGTPGLSPLAVPTSGLSILPGRFRWSDWGAAPHKPWSWTGYSQLSAVSTWLTDTSFDPGGAGYYVAFSTAIPVGANWITWRAKGTLSSGAGATWEALLQYSTDGGTNWTTLFDSGNTGVAPLTGFWSYGQQAQRSDPLPAGTTHVRFQARNLPLGFGQVSMSGTTAIFQTMTGSPAGTRLGGVFVDQDTLSSMAVNGDLNGGGNWGWGNYFLDLKDLGGGERNTGGMFSPAGSAGPRVGHIGFQADGLVHAWWTFPDGHQQQEDTGGFNPNPSATLLLGADSFGRHPLTGSSNFRSFDGLYQGVNHTVVFIAYVGDFSTGYSSKVFNGDLVSCAVQESQVGVRAAIFRDPTTGALSVIAQHQNTTEANVFTTVSPSTPYPAGQVLGFTPSSGFPHYGWATWASGRLTTWLKADGTNSLLPIQVSGQAPLLPGNRDLHITNCPPAIIIQDGVAVDGFWLLQLTNDQQQIWATPFQISSYSGLAINTAGYVGDPILWKQAPAGSYFGPMDGNLIPEAPGRPCSGIFYVCGPSPTSRSPVCFDYFRLPFSYGNYYSQGYVTGQ